MRGSVALLGSLGVPFYDFFVILRNAIFAIIIVITEIAHFLCAHLRAACRLLFGNTLACNLFTANDTFLDLQAFGIFRCFLDRYPFARLVAAEEGNDLRFFFAAMASSFLLAVFGTGGLLRNLPHTELMSARRDRHGLTQDLSAENAVRALRAAGCGASGFHGGIDHLNVIADIFLRSGCDDGCCGSFCEIILRRCGQNLNESVDHTVGVVDPFVTVEKFVRDGIRCRAHDGADAVFDTGLFIFCGHRLIIVTVFGRCVFGVRASDIGNLFSDRIAVKLSGVYAGYEQKAGAIVHSFLQGIVVIFDGADAVAQIARRYEAGKALLLQFLAKLGNDLHILGGIRDENVARHEGFVYARRNLFRFRRYLGCVFGIESGIALLISSFDEQIQFKQKFALQGRGQKTNDRLEKFIIFFHVNAADQLVDLLDVARERFQIKIRLKIVGQIFFDLGRVKAHVVFADVLGLDGVVKIASLIVDGFDLRLIQKFLKYIEFATEGVIFKIALAIRTTKQLFADDAQFTAAVRTRLTNLCHGDLLDVFCIIYPLYYKRTDKSRTKRIFSGQQ